MNYKNIILCFAALYSGALFAPGAGAASSSSESPANTAVVADHNFISMDEFMRAHDIKDLRKKMYNIFDIYGKLIKISPNDPGGHDIFTKDLSGLTKHYLASLISTFQAIKHRQQVLDSEIVAFLIKAAHTKDIARFMSSDENEIKALFTMHDHLLDANQRESRPILCENFVQLHQALKAIIPKDQIQAFREFLDFSGRIEVSEHDTVADWKQDFTELLASLDRLGQPHSPFLVTHAATIDLISRKISEFEGPELTKIAGMLFDGLLQTSEHRIKELANIDGLNRRVAKIFDAAREIPGFASYILDLMTRNLVYMDEKGTPDVFHTSIRQFDNFMGRGFIDSWLEPQEDVAAVQEPEVVEDELIVNLPIKDMDGEMGL